MHQSEDGLKAAVQQYRAEKQRRTRNPTALTNKQKRELAASLIQAAGGIVGNLRAQPSAGLDPGDAAKQLALWLKDLPGECWDERLGQRDWQNRELYALLGLNDPSPKERPGVKVEGFDI